MLRRVTSLKLLKITVTVKQRLILRWPVPGFSRLFPKYFSLISSLRISQKISHFPTISQLFPIYFTVISHFSILFHLFPNYFSFPNNASRFSVTLPNYFSVISQLFPSESPDISAIYNWLISALTWCDHKIKIIISRVLRGVLNGSSRLPGSSFFCR